MKQLKTIIDNNWFFPVIVLYYGVFYILFGERIIINDGLGVDGLVYAEVAKGNFNSLLLNNYTVTRIFPAYVVHLIMEAFSITYTIPNIISTFEVVNLILVVLSAFYLKKIFVFLKISLKIQVLCFMLFTLNIAVLKFSFYCPDGTDTDALFLGTMLVYFYLVNNQVGLFLISLMAAFTWPLIAYQGIVMFLFPVDKSTDHQSVNSKYLRLIRYISVLFALSFFVYYIFYNNADIEAYTCLRINKNLVYLSCLIVLFVFYHFASPFINGQLYYKLIKQIKTNSFFIRILIVGVTMAAVGYIYKQLVVDPNPSQFLSLARALKLSFLFSVVRPGFSIVAHFGYFGLLIVFLILFWTKFCKALSSYGVGIVLGFTMYLYLLGIMCETRLITPLLPFLVIFLAKAISNIKFSNMFYYVSAVFGIIASKIWLTMDYKASAGIDENGCRDMPDQLFLMNFGPWMSEQMYLIQGFFMLLFLGILFFMIYKIEVTSENKIKITKKIESQI